MLIGRVFLIVCIVTGLAACNGDGDGGTEKGAPAAGSNVQWISTGEPCSEIAEVEADPRAKETVGLMMCTNASKSFTGELRCERNFMEIGCK